MTTNLIHLSALLALLGVAVVYGTDIFCAMVLRPALAHVDDTALAAVVGNIHRFGDRRMRIPGVLGIAGAAAGAALAIWAGTWPHAIACGVALTVLLIWMVLYTRISAPINRQLTAASDAGVTLPNVRDLQADWDRVITARALLQGLAVAALGGALWL
jgi:hypothetical protein